MHYNDFMEYKAQVKNAEMFMVFEDIKSTMDEYYIKLIGGKSDSDSHIHYHLRQHVDVMLISTSDFFANEEAFQGLTGSGFYSFKSISELFRQYLSYMRKIFIQQATVDSTLEGEDIEVLNEVFDIINQTFIVVVMEKLLSIIFNTVENISDSIIIDLVELEIKNEYKAVNNEEFKSIVQANMWEFDMGKIIPDGLDGDKG